MPRSTGRQHGKGGAPHTCRFPTLSGKRHSTAASHGACSSRRPANGHASHQSPLILPSRWQAGDSRRTGADVGIPLPATAGSGAEFSAATRSIMKPNRLERETTYVCGCPLHYDHRDRHPRPRLPPPRRPGRPQGGPPPHRHRYPGDRLWAIGRPHIHALRGLVGRRRSANSGRSSVKPIHRDQCAQHQA